MTAKASVYVIQFARVGDFKKNVEKARSYLEKAGNLDFVLIGGEFSLGESKNTDPYPPLIDLAKSFNCNIVAPINANFRRFPKTREKGYSSMHIFDRRGKIAAIQDKQHFYWREKPWFKRGEEIKIFEVDGVKLGMVRGLDILYAEYTQKLREAEIVFFSTMAIDDMMLELAMTRALENQFYIVMSSFIGHYVGMVFLGNAAVIEPSFAIRKGMKMANQTKLLDRIREEGSIQAELDINYIRAIKKEYPIAEL